MPPVPLGSLVWTGIQPVLQVIILTAAGVFMARMGVLDAKGRKSLSQLIYYVFIPCLTFAKLAGSVDLANLASWALLPLNIVLSIAIGAGLGLLCCRIARPPTLLRPHLICAVTLGNVGNLPLVIVQGLCRNPAAPFAADFEQPEQCESRGLAYTVFAMWVAGIYQFTVAHRLMAPRNDSLAVTLADAPGKPGPGPGAGVEAHSSGSDAPVREYGCEEAAEGPVLQPLHAVPAAPAVRAGPAVPAELRSAAPPPRSVEEEVELQQVSGVKGEAAPVALHRPRRPPLATLDSAINASSWQRYQRLQERGEEEELELGGNPGSSAEMGARDRGGAWSSGEREGEERGGGAWSGRERGSPSSGRKEGEHDGMMHTGGEGQPEEMDEGDEERRPLRGSPRGRERGGGSPHEQGSWPPGGDPHRAGGATPRGPPRGERSSGSPSAAGAFHPRGNPIGNPRAAPSRGSSAFWPPRWLGAGLGCGCGCNQGLRTLLRMVREAAWKGANPPTLAAFAALVVGCVPALRGLLFGPTAPLMVLTNCMESLGAAMIPAMMMMLGSLLANGPGKDSQMPNHVVALVVLVRLIVMPLTGMGVVFGCRALGLIHAPDRLFILTLLLGYTSPTATNLQTLATLHTNGEAEVSTMLFWQYIAALPILPMLLAFYLRVI